MDNPEKLATLDTQYTTRRQTKQKHNTMCTFHHCRQAHTNNVNKIWALHKQRVAKRNPTQL